MNTQEYISSGIIESYVLGLASPEEMAEFELRSATEPAIREAREAFEVELENSLRQQAVNPPAALRNKIFARFAAEEITSARPGSENTAPVISAPAETPVVTMASPFYKYAAAAAVVLLLGSAAFNVYLYNQYNDSVARYQSLAATQTAMALNNQNLKVKLDNYDSAIAQMRNPQVDVIKMAAVPTSPDPSGVATVYWNSSSKDVYLLVNQLPKAVAGKQYQLWAIVDGKPVDAGVFDTDGQSIVKMKTIAGKAQAFAVTLENTGGSPAPTMTAMYVLGKVTG